MLRSSKGLMVLRRRLLLERRVQRKALAKMKCLVGSPRNLVICSSCLVRLLSISCLILALCLCSRLRNCIENFSLYSGSIREEW